MEAEGGGRGGGESANRMIAIRARPCGGHASAWNVVGWAALVADHHAAPRFDQGDVAGCLGGAESCLTC